MDQPITRAEHISIHALREEGDGQSLQKDLTMDVFLSTPSARRATYHISPTLPSGTNFYPRPPRGGRLPAALAASCKISISIHALREEGDCNVFIYLYV